MSPAIVVVAAIIERENHFLVTRRQPGVHLEGLWEFPGGKCHADEPHEIALKRELREELDVDADVGAQVFEVSHAYPDREIELHFYACTLRGTPRPLLGQEMRWVARHALTTLDLPPADLQLIHRLTNGQRRD